MGEVREVAVRYKTTDGREHETKEDAERAQALIDAEHAYEQAKRAFETALGQSVRTADGKPFRFGYLTSWYIVQWAYNAPPRVVEVTASWYDRDVVLEDGRVRVRVWDRQNDGTYRRRDYLIGEIYAERRNAEKEASKERAEWLRSTLKDFPDLRDALAAEMEGRATDG